MIKLLEKLLNLIYIQPCYFCKSSKEDKLLCSKCYSKIRFLPAGVVPPNPAELVRSEEMMNLLDELKRRYDYRIIDTSPLIVVFNNSFNITYAAGIKSPIIINNR